MKTTEMLIAEANKLITKSQNLRNFNDHDLHGKVASLIEEKNRKSSARKEAIKKTRSDPRFKDAAAQVTAMEDRARSAARESVMSEKEMEVRKTWKHQ